jgi:putative FmdB family regulatory protein
MPVYTYKCDECDGTFEITQKITENPLKKCQLNGCRGAVKRVIHTPGVIFKGTGFHVNDYPDSKGKKRSDTPKSETADSSTTTSSEDKSDKKSDTKPEGKKSTESKSDSKGDKKSGKAA